MVDPGEQEAKGVLAPSDRPLAPKTQLTSVKSHRRMQGGCGALGVSCEKIRGTD
jgi:hypothetical protein